jgi:hypothetical protein
MASGAGEAARETSLGIDVAQTKDADNEEQRICEKDERPEAGDTAHKGNSVVTAGKHKHLHREKYTDEIRTSPDLSFS